MMSIAFGNRCHQVETKEDGSIIIHKESYKTCHTIPAYKSQIETETMNYYWDKANIPLVYTPNDTHC